MVSASSKKKNLLDLEHQRLLNIINIIVLSASTIVISSTVALWARQIEQQSYLLILVITAALGFVLFQTFEGKRKKIIEEIRNL